MKTGNSNNAEVGVDTQPLNGTAVGTTALSGEGTLNFGAPVFTAVGSMNSSVPVKGQDTKVEKWKGTGSVEIPVSSMHLELSPGFVSPEPIYYVPQEYINGYVNQVFPEPLTNGDSIHYGQAGGEPTSPANGDTSANLEALSTEDLKRMIRQQFEYYFSRENLVNDTYLVSQMDNDKFVPIATVARFNQIKKLTSDLALIAEALRDSQHIQLDENGEKVRANVKRCIVILREIPDSTPIKEVEDLFNSPNCPKYTNCEFAHNNSWYVTFDTEEDAQKAYRYLREEVKTFHGKPIMARIKAKTLLSRSTLVRPPSTGQASASQPETSPQPQPQPPPQQVFSQRQFNTFTVPAPVIGGQQPFPYYPPGTIVQTAWIDSRQQFFPPEMIPSSPNFVKPITITGPRPFFATTKQRMQTKTFFKADNADRLSEKEDRPSSNNMSNNSSRRPAQNHRNGGGSNYIHKDNNDSYLRRMYPTRNKREEVVPRFQRLRERERRQMEQNSLENVINNLSIDLASEHFPALPSPISPNEKSMQTATLKDLATNALQQAELVQEIKAEKVDETTSEVAQNGQTSSPPPPCRTPPPSENNQSLKPSYAQMAQKPILKVTAASKSPTEASTGKEARKTSTKDDAQNGQKNAKSSSQKSNAEEKDTQKKDSDSSDKSGLSPKPQRQPRDSRIASDSKINQKSVSSGTRSNSYSGQLSAPAKESYAAKSSIGATQAGSVRSPPTKPRTAATATNQGLNKNAKNSPKATNNGAKAVPASENEQEQDEASVKAVNQVQANVEQNNNRKEEGEAHQVEEN